MGHVSWLWQSLFSDVQVNSGLIRHEDAVDSLCFGKTSLRKRL